MQQDAIRKARRVDSSPPARGNNTSSAKQQYGVAVPDLVTTTTKACDAMENNK